MAPWAVVSILFIFTFTPFVTASNFVEFDRALCMKEIVEKNLSYDDPIFYRSKDGQPMSHPNNMTLTLDACKAQCGPRRGFYKDIGPRLTAWLIPILLLISNVELSPLDKRRYLSIVHLLGDPIHSMFAFVHKAESWSQCFYLSRQRYGMDEDRTKVFATILAAVEEVKGAELDFNRTEGDLTTILRDLVGTERLPGGKEYRFWSEVAVDMADGRTDELLRTVLAILLYVYQVVAAFVPEVGGGSTSPPGGRIGTAMFISWLVPIVLLSNAVGGFTSRRTCIRTLKRIARNRGQPLNIDLKEYFKTQSWSGAIYSYRPRKRLFTGGNTPRMMLLLLLSILPVIISMSGAFAIIWKTPPDGFNCRHIWVLSIGFTWVFSALLTHFSYRFMPSRVHWYLTLTKDTLIAIPSLVWIFLSSCGYFNSCYCWSGVLMYGADAHVPMNTDPLFERNAKTIYPKAVGITLGIQVLVFLCIVGVVRHGLGLMRWGEKRRSKVFEETYEDDEEIDQNEQDGQAPEQNGGIPKENNGGGSNRDDDIKLPVIVPVSI